LFPLDFDKCIPQSKNDDTRIDPLWTAAQPTTYVGRSDEPTRAEVLLQLGILYWRRGDLDRSERLLVKARDVSKEDQNIRFLAQCFIGLALVKNSLEKDNDAIAAYEQAIMLVPKNFHIWNNLGNLYLKHKKFEQALDAFKKALRINPDDIVAWTGLANAYDQHGCVDEAIQAYKRTIDLTSTSKTDAINRQFILPWLRLGVLYTKKCLYQKAIDAYQKALALDIKNAEIWNALGELQIKMEAYAASIPPLSKAINLNPKYGQAYLNLAFAYTKLGKQQESLFHYMKSIDLLENQREKELALDLMEGTIRSTQENKKSEHPKKSVSQNAATWFYYKYNEEITSINFSSPSWELKQSNKGGKEMPHILPLSSLEETQAQIENTFPNTQDQEIKNITAYKWNEKGNTHFNNHEYSEAIIAYNKAIEIDSSIGQPYNNLALVLFMQGKYEKAILVYKEGLKLLTDDQEKAIAWNGLGNVYRRIKDYENARIAYQNASELDLKNGGVYDKTIIDEASKKHKTADFWNDLGKLFFKVGVYDKAASAFRKAIQLEPSSGYSYGYLARSLTAQGQYKEAVALYHKSIDLISDNTDKANVWNRLGDVHRKLNDYDNALKAYQNGTELTNNQPSLLSRTRFSLLSNCTAK